MYSGAWSAGFNGPPDTSTCLTWAKSKDFTTGALYAGDESPDYSLADRSC
jgi:hypothetical protein